MKIAWMLVLILCSCSISSKKRTPASAGQEWQSYINARQNEYRQEALRQLGLENQNRLTREDRSKVYWRTKVLKAEDKMESPSKRQQYYKYHPYFVNDRQRMAFLELDNLTSRQAWIEEYLNYKPDKYEDKVQTAIDNKDLVPYMTKDAVIRSWGQPDNVEGSGNDIYGNERWKYTFYLDTADGEITEERYLYFERGKLVGWETVED